MTSPLSRAEHHRPNICALTRIKRALARSGVSPFPFCNAYIVNRHKRLGVLLLSEIFSRGGTMSTPPSPTSYPVTRGGHK